uniref:Uncharacterized protein n=1 Tax=Arundo donax TaxID=35708 RepID=A0A0A8ZHW6_ARUDO
MQLHLRQVRLMSALAARVARRRPCNMRLMPRRSRHRHLPPPGSFRSRLRRGLAVR